MIRDFVIILDVGNENVFWILIKGGAECEQQIFSKKLVSGSSEIQDIDVYVFDTEYLARFEKLRLEGKLSKKRRYVLLNGSRKLYP